MVHAGAEQIRFCLFSATREPRRPESGRLRQGRLPPVCIRPLDPLLGITRRGRLQNGCSFYRRVRQETDSVFPSPSTGRASFFAVLRLLGSSCLNTKLVLWVRRGLSFEQGKGPGPKYFLAGCASQ